MALSAYLENIAKVHGLHSPEDVNDLQSTKITRIQWIPGYRNCVPVSSVYDLIMVSDAGHLDLSFGCGHGVVLPAFAQA